MASTIKVDKLDPQSGTALEIGTSGDTVTVPSGVGLTLTDSTLLLPTTINTDKIDPKSGTALEIGTSGDTITVPTGAGLTVTDEVKTNKISPATGTAFALGDSGDTFTVPSGATIVNSGTATGFGGGKVLQVVDVATEGTVTTTSTSYVAVTGMTLDITPSATSSKILLIHSANIQTGSGFVGYFTIYRDSTDISVSGGTNEGLGALYSALQNTATSMHFSKLDSPSTTSQITYTVRFKSSNGTTVYYGEPGGTTTTLIAIEIGA